MGQRARYRVHYRRKGKVRTAIVNSFSAADARKHYPNVIKVERADVKNTGSRQRAKRNKDGKPKNGHWFYR